MQAEPSTTRTNIGIILYEYIFTLADMINETDMLNEFN
jgi:hypothetical protein